MNVVRLNNWKTWAVLSLGITICLGGCTQKPTDEQLEVWRREASDRNVQIMADNAKKRQQREWNLLIQGQTATGKPATVSWQELVELATTEVETNDPNHVSQVSQMFNFQGISVASLLKKFGYQPGTTEVTFVCYDAYQVTVKLQDLLTYPIILAIARDGKPIQRDQGGPIYLVFPHSQYPQLKQTYNDSMWAFYVSHMVIGTETAQVKVGNREFNLEELDKLPQVKLLQPVGYRAWWPSTPIPLHGVRIRDLLAAANLQVSDAEKIVVKGKPPIYQSNLNPISINAADIRECDLILATRWGEDKQPIPAKMGGPVTLAVGKNCKGKTQAMPWVTFVEELSIQP
ncbi:hypothetical protein B6N60_03392 [Richelia sinica FACHB-800]|uniref:Oxidoreductase molybdopterin-binding domain-containing protein n=1 Tax=Richelia sinica FACHB-800 TaxID=1357546 RepID=A0A975T9P1_9NOST|nr:hypothetical protein B6N60_03392 [Richelia sinica FACHB-800]